MGECGHHAGLGNGASEPFPYYRRGSTEWITVYERRAVRRAALFLTFIVRQGYAVRRPPTLPPCVPKGGAWRGSDRQRQHRQAAAERHAGQAEPHPPGRYGMVRQGRPRAVSPRGSARGLETGSRRGGRGGCGTCPESHGNGSAGRPALPMLSVPQLMYCTLTAYPRPIVIAWPQTPRLSPCPNPPATAPLLSAPLACFVCAPPRLGCFHSPLPRSPAPPGSTLVWTSQTRDATCH